MAKEILKKRKLTCTNCGKEKPPTTGFYLSQSKLYKFNDGRMTICKDCLFDKYDELSVKYGDENKSLYHLCMMFDIYFSNDLVKSSYSQKDRSNDKKGLLQAYITKLNSLPQYKGMCSFQSDYVILDEKVIKDLEDKYKVEVKEEKVTLEKEDTFDYDSVKIAKEVKKRWGSGYSNEDYIFLEDSYQEFYDAYPHESPAERLLLRQLSQTLLEGETCRRKGDRTGYEKMSKLVSSMLTDSNIKPSQKKTMGDEIGECFGVFIENIEKNEPIPGAIDEFEDVDGIGKYMDKHFVKNFAKIFGLVGDDNEDKD